MAGPVKPEHITRAAPQAKSEFDHPITLGAAAKTSASLIVWCRGPDCHHQNRTDPADLAQIFGPISWWPNGASGWSARGAVAGMSRCCSWDAAVRGTDAPPFAAAATGIW